MKVKRIEREVFVSLNHKANAPTLVHGLRHVIAKPERALHRKIDNFCKRNRELNVIPTLIIRLRHAGLPEYAKTYASGERGRQHQITNFHLCRARV